jgi:Replication-relaxation
VTGTRRGMVLQERDLQLLRELVLLRIVDREQAQLLCRFRSITRANTRLLALTRAGLLNRFFVGTFSGGKKSLYALSRKGTSLIAATGPILQRRRDAILVGDRFIDHQLKINSIYLITRRLPIQIAGLSCSGWLALKEPLTAASGLIPDGYFELATEAKTTCCFLEVDLGTENLSVWKEKVERYLAYAVSGAFETQFRRSQFRVLVLADTERRLHSIRAVTAKHTDKIFWISSFDLIESQSFWAPIWFRPTSTEPQLLFGGEA